jgi:2,4-dienoyl-CoA reductase-like NADH-dependent reductase (Old Yellow Enzyme family)
MDGNHVSEMSAAPVSMANLARLGEMLARGEFDLVGVGRMLLRNPEWPNLIRQGRFESLKAYEPAKIPLFLECADL